MAESNSQELARTQPGKPLAKDFPELTKEQRAERLAAINAANGAVSDVESAVRREFGTLDWNRQSRASIVSRITAAIQNIDSAEVGVLNKATRTIIQEIYAIDEWPVSKRVVLGRATAAIRRLKLGS